MIFPPPKHVFFSIIEMCSLLRRLDDRSKSWPAGMKFELQSSVFVLDPPKLCTNHEEGEIFFLKRDARFSQLSTPRETTCLPPVSGSTNQGNRPNQYDVNQWYNYSSRIEGCRGCYLYRYIKLVFLLYFFFDLSGILLSTLGNSNKVRNMHATNYSSYQATTGSGSGCILSNSVSSIPGLSPFSFPKYTSKQRNQQQQVLFAFTTGGSLLQTDNSLDFNGFRFGRSLNNTEGA